MAEIVEVHEPYHEASQQHEADLMGMYIFLASEIMLFGGLFAVAFVLRVLHPEEVVEASKRLHLWIGAINTVILLTSGLLAALAVQAARAGLRREASLFFGATAALGVGFLGVKAYEYYIEYRDGILPAVSDPARFSGPVEHLYMDLYFVATGLHAIHVTIGILLLGGVGLSVARGWLAIPQRAVVVETSALYWALVDVIWVFLYPVLYLAR